MRLWLLLPFALLLLLAIPPATAQVVPVITAYFHEHEGQPVVHEDFQSYVVDASASVGIAGQPVHWSVDAVPVDPDEEENEPPADDPLFSPPEFAEVPVDESRKVQAELDPGDCGKLASPVPVRYRYELILRIGPDPDPGEEDTRPEDRLRFGMACKAGPKVVVHGGAGRTTPELHVLEQTLFPAVADISERYFLVDGTSFAWTQPRDPQDVPIRGGSTDQAPVIASGNSFQARYWFQAPPHTEGSNCPSFGAAPDAPPPPKCYHIYATALDIPAPVPGDPRPVIPQVPPQRSSCFSEGTYATSPVPLMTGCDGQTRVGLQNGTDTYSPNGGAPLHHDTSRVRVHLNLPPIAAASMSHDDNGDGLPDEDVAFSGQNAVPDPTVVEGRTFDLVPCGEVNNGENELGQGLEGVGCAYDPDIGYHPDQLYPPDQAEDLPLPSPHGLFAPGHVPAPTFVWEEVGSSLLTIPAADADGYSRGILAPDVDVVTPVTVRLTITDNVGATATADTTFKINPAPVADAGPDAMLDESTIAKPSVITLSAGATTDSNTGPFDLDFHWTYLPEPGQPDITLDTPDAMATKFTAPQLPTGDPPMVLTFQVDVTDNAEKGHSRASSSDTVQITLLNNIPPTTEITGTINGATLPFGGAGREDDEIVLRATATDEDGTIASHHWRVDADPLALFPDPLNLGATDTVSFTVPLIADDITYTFRHTATDDDGEQDDAVFQVELLGNLEPIVIVPAEITADEGEVLLLDGEDTYDPDGEVVAYSWAHRGGVQPAAWTNLDQSSSRLTTPFLDDIGMDQAIIVGLSAQDDYGEFGVSQDLVIRVIYNVPPVADAGPGGFVPEGGFHDLDASASSDAEGPITSYSWRVVRGPAVLFDDEATATPRVHVPQVARDAVLDIELTVTDAKGKTGTSVVRLIIDDDPPIQHADEDGDGVPDNSDNCPLTVNTDQKDTDHDGRGDACDPSLLDGPAGDPDNDGLPNSQDNCDSVRNADQADGDGDKRGDVCDPDLTDGPLGDADGDGRANHEDNCEDIANASQADFDGDGIGDVCDPEPADPFADGDGDGLSDAAEIQGGTDPRNPDSDGDGLGDGDETVAGTDPTKADTDGDGLRDGDERTHRTDPNDADTDGDGVLDGVEVASGSDPLRKEQGGDQESAGSNDLRSFETLADGPAEQSARDDRPTDAGGRTGWLIGGALLFILLAIAAVMVVIGPRLRANPR